MSDYLRNALESLPNGDVYVQEYDALLSRIDTLEAERDRLRAGLDRYVSAHDGPTGSLARCMAAEAQVEALTEALRDIVHYEEPWPQDAADVYEHFQAVAREALSRVSRSEPNCPECGSGLLNGEHIAKYECSRRSEPAPPNGITAEALAHIERCEEAIRKILEGSEPVRRQGLVEACLIYNEARGSARRACSAPPVPEERQ